MSTTPTMSVCGLPLPLLATFDFDAYQKCPADIAAPPDMELGDKNAQDIAILQRNKTSVTTTRAYQRAAASTAGVGSLRATQCAFTVCCLL
ncbi:hypothetical protein MVEN_00048700 [Mycena venus]|uniref:Uncharacterized protein n=1 Tax=Mycena venus TaxID=2733690 RepID=A0A8H6Z3H5_9AGAR|nr:hypothetical protein MVEN_00048700 [Mycena venus]